MFGNIIKHHKECVEFYSLATFKKLLASSFGFKNDEIVFDTDNKGVKIGKRFWTWTELAEEVGWFDEAEIVTDKDEREKVMTWLNVD